MSQDVNVPQKRAIARAAAELIAPGESIIINGGTTTFALVEFLENSDLDILTNSFPIAAKLFATSRNRITLPGGTLFREQNIVLSPFENDTIESFWGNKLFVGCYGLNRFGMMEGRVSQDKYWRDVGTLDSYYLSNMALLQPVPPIDLYQENWPIRAYSAQSPPAKIAHGESGNEGVCSNSIIANGVIISGGSVYDSILFPRVRIDDGASVRRSILFERAHIGKGARIQNCIVEKNVHVPDHEDVGFDMIKDRQRFTVSQDGIVVIPQGSQFD